MMLEQFGAYSSSKKSYKVLQNLIGFYSLRFSRTIIQTVPARHHLLQKLAVPNLL